MYNRRYNTPRAYIYAMFLPMIYSFSFVEIVINFFVLSDGYKTLLALPHRQSIASESSKQKGIIRK